jgi:hypothetical protein
VNPGCCKLPGRRVYCKPDKRQIGLLPYPTPLFLEKSLQTTENKRAECEKESQESTRGGKLLRTQDLPHRHGEQRGRRDSEHRGPKGQYTPVATGSMRKVLRAGEILAPRGAYDGRSRWLRKHTRDGERMEGRNGDTVSRTLLGGYRIRYHLSSEK